MKQFIFIHDFLFYKQKEHLSGFLRAPTSHSRRAPPGLWLSLGKEGKAGDVLSPGLKRWRFLGDGKAEHRAMSSLGRWGGQKREQGMERESDLWKRTPRCLRPAGSVRLQLRAQYAQGVSAPPDCTVIALTSPQWETGEIILLHIRFSLLFSVQERIEFCKVAPPCGPASWFFASQKLFIFLYDYLLL